MFEAGEVCTTWQPKHQVLSARTTSMQDERRTAGGSDDSGWQLNQSLTVFSVLITLARPQLCFTIACIYLSTKTVPACEFRQHTPSLFKSQSWVKMILFEISTSRHFDRSATSRCSKKHLWPYEKHTASR